MCGIFGIISYREANERVFEGLKRIEYRGYDSAGISVTHNGKIYVRRAVGKVEALGKILDSFPLPSSNTSIGHMRWPTHGIPSEKNAHPISTPRVAVVHNGIIENYHVLKDEIGHEQFTTETDTEVIVHLVDGFLVQGHTPQDAVRLSLDQLNGAFAVAMIFAEHPEMIIAARRGSPLVIGLGENEMFLASDPISLAPLTKEFIYLEDNDWCVLTKEGADLFRLNGTPVQRPVKKINFGNYTQERGDFPHFMLKEIHEQPDVIQETLDFYLDSSGAQIEIPQLSEEHLASLKQLTIVACGTSYYAGLMGAYWIEKLARIPVKVEIASEFRYKNPPLNSADACLFISQSGETADTLGALEYAKLHQQQIWSIINVPESSIARASDAVMYTKAGPEIGVASTKALTTQMVVLVSLAIKIGKAQKKITAHEESRLISLLHQVSTLVKYSMHQNANIEKMASRILSAKSVIYLGRGSSFPVTLEGALKLKELSYIHAEAFAAGEMKHGPIALIDEQMPVVVVAPSDHLFEKTMSNLEEVKARGAQILLITDALGAQKYPDLDIIEMPEIDPFIMPFVYIIPMQLLAYHTANLLGCDVDKPRNLAKSVTVE